MTELRFHRDVYAGTVVDEAVKRFGAFATFALREEPQHWVVQLTAPTPEREARVAGELGNYALGTTIKHGGARQR
ncbi:MAG TPA: HxsD-like protein [Polyangia bacterium]|nr:HxsD-like protein [Polyangia bacterium]